MRLLDEQHSEAFSAKANLTAVYCNQGRWDKAAKLARQVVDASLNVLGERHASTLVAMANLASTYRKLGRVCDSEELWIRIKQYKSCSHRQEAKIITSYHVWRMFVAGSCLLHACWRCIYLEASVSGYRFAKALVGKHIGFVVNTMIAREGMTGLVFIIERKDAF